MNELYRWGNGALAALFTLTITGWAIGPIDTPTSNEPRVPVAKCLTMPGLVESKGRNHPWVRVRAGDTLFSRDVLVAIPGFKIDLESRSGGVKLTLWGNLPELSDSLALESSVILHDTGAYDLDVTILQGRLVFTNTKEKGAARIWIRAEDGVQMVLPNPGDTAAIEVFGRWPSGVPFIAGAKGVNKPLRLWEVYCLKGNLELKASQVEWYMTQPPGKAYFHGDNVEGPARGGPERLDAVPSWFDAKAARSKKFESIADVVKTYTGRLKTTDPDEIEEEILALADKETNRDRAKAMRMLVVYAMQAIDEVDKVANALSNSKHPEMRQAAVISLRHWISANEGRDQRLYEMLQNDLGYTRTEADTILQLLHSPFNPDQPETYETLIAYLKHRKQAIRELSHWHLVRLAPIGRDVPFDAAGSAEERAKSVAAWQALIPAGELPKEKPDDSK